MVARVEPVVRAGLDHEDRRRILQDPVDGRKRPGGGHPAVPAVHHLDLEPGRIGLLLDQGGVGLIGVHTQTGGEGGTEEDYAGAGAGALRRCGGEALGVDDSGGGGPFHWLGTPDGQEDQHCRDESRFHPYAPSRRPHQDLYLRWP